VSLSAVMVDVDRRGIKLYSNTDESDLSHTNKKK